MGCTMCRSLNLEGTQAGEDAQSSLKTPLSMLQLGTVDNPGAPKAGDTKEAEKTTEGDRMKETEAEEDTSDVEFEGF